MGREGVKRLKKIKYVLRNNYSLDSVGVGDEAVTTEDLLSDPLSCRAEACRKLETAESTSHVSI